MHVRSKAVERLERLERFERVFFNAVTLESRPVWY